MGYCTNCGHELGVGRFCTNCGHPVDVSTARYPLYADEGAPASQPAAPPAPPPAPPRAPRARWPWLAVATALVLLLVLLVLLVVAVRLVTGDDDPPVASDRGSTPSSPDRPRDANDANDADNIAADASVTVPATAPPNQDTAGNRTTYVGANLLDGVPETCWRMAGDGTGEEITLTLPAETHLTEVGLVNGYAKEAEDARGRELDWYHGNRRVLTVEWRFDDGSAIAQDLTDTTQLQAVDVDVTTTTVVLRLVSVSDPGTGPSRRDYTAISDVALVAG